MSSRDPDNISNSRCESQSSELSYFPRIWDTFWIHNQVNRLSYQTLLSSAMLVDNTTVLQREYIPFRIAERYGTDADMRNLNVEFTYSENYFQLRVVLYIFSIVEQSKC